LLDTLGSGLGNSPHWRLSALAPCVFPGVFTNSGIRAFSEPILRFELRVGKLGLSLLVGSPYEALFVGPSRAGAGGLSGGVVVRRTRPQVHHQRRVGAAVHPPLRGDRRS